MKQVELKFGKFTPNELKEKGIPIWNNCNHYLVDMSHMSPEGGDDADWMNTIVVKLPNGNYVTLCVMQSGKMQTCIDAAFHGDNIEKHRVAPMGGGNSSKPNEDRNIYALIADAKEVI